MTKRFSRTFLQGLAITEKLNAAVVYDRDLDSEEKERIVQLAAGATNPDAVLHTITGRINQLPLSTLCVVCAQSATDFQVLLS